MKKNDYLYYSPTPSVYGRKRSFPEWQKDLFKIVIVFVLGLLLTM